jgi:hypothetical protein
MMAMMLPVLETKEEEFMSRVPGVDIQISKVDGQLRQLSIIDNTHQSGGVKMEESRLDLVAKLEQQRNLLEGYQALCSEVVRNIRQEQTGQTIENVAADDGDLLVGIFNVEDKGGIKREIKNIGAKRGDRAVVRVANMDIEKFF